MGSLSELEPPCGAVAEPPNKSFERDASIACFSSFFLQVRLNACARRGSIRALGFLNS